MARHRKTDTKAKTNMPSQRQLRVAEQVRHELAKVLLRGHFSDEALMDAARITVTEVRISPDLKNAKAYVMPLGGKDMDKILPALNDHSKYFQGEVARVLETKYSPKIRFIADDSFGEAQRIERILYDLQKSKKAAADDSGDTGDAEEAQDATQDKGENEDATDDQNSVS